MPLRIRSRGTRYYTIPFTSFNTDFRTEWKVRIPGSMPEDPSCIMCFENSTGATNSLIAIYSDVDGGVDWSLILDVYDDTGTLSQDIYAVPNPLDFIQGITLFKLRQLGSAITLEVTFESMPSITLNATLTDGNATFDKSHLGGFQSTVYGGPSGILRDLIEVIFVHGDILKFGAAFDPNDDPAKPGSDVKTVVNKGSFGGFWVIDTPAPPYWELLQQDTGPGPSPPPATGLKPAGAVDAAELARIRKELATKFGIR